MLRHDRKGTPKRTTPVAAGTTNIGNNTVNHAFEHASTIASHTIVMPPQPRDGQVVRLLFRAAVTAVTHNASTGHTIRNGLTVATAGQAAAWIFSAADMVWRRYL